MKVLLISHNPLSTYNNMGKTLAALFSSFEKNELCQLYVYPSIPDIEYCESYFRITDKDILNSLLSFTKVKGRIIMPNLNQHSQFEREEDRDTYRNPKNKKAIRVLLRAICWRCKNWYNKELKTWLDQEKPSHIFIAPGTGLFLYDMALNISHDYNIPIITYICDDYYFIKNSIFLLENLKNYLLKNKIEKLMKKTKYIVAISDDARDNYAKYWNIPSSTIMTGSNFKAPLTKKNIENPQKIVYMGNIRCNRFLSLLKIGEVLDEINKEKGTSYSLEIYSGERDQGILSLFNNIKSIKNCGYVSGEEFKRVMCSADILLHTEAFDEKSISRVKSSISTKIADLLSSGIPVFAYSPKNIASTEYLRENDCAVIADEIPKLKEKLLIILESNDIRKQIVKNGIRVAKKNHDLFTNSIKIRKIMELV